jgi:hypothetical protein
MRRLAIGVERLAVADEAVMEHVLKGAIIRVTSQAAAR